MEPEGETSTRTGSVRILIVDDHDLVRHGYRLMLDHEEDLEVVAEASNGLEAIELCRKLRPDLVLMDVRMPKMDGLEATRRIKGEFPTTSVLVVTSFDSPDYLLEAIEAGAAGYVPKGAPMRRLVNAIRRTLNGEYPLNQELAAQLISRLARDAQHVRAPATPPPMPQQREAVTVPREGLTTRELQILQILAQGKSNPQIAEELVISRGTVKVHVEHIISKLGVSDRTHAVVRAITMGLVTLGRD